MSFDKKTGQCLCERCGYEWKARYDFDFKMMVSFYREPRSCAKCKSTGWNKPRVYGGKYLDGLAPMAKRYKPTGRQAAKLSPERIRKEKFEQLKNNWIQARREYFSLESQWFEMSKNGEFKRYPEQKRQMDYLLDQASEKIIEAEESFIISKANQTMTWKEFDEVKEVFNNILYRESKEKKFSMKSFVDLNFVDLNNVQKLAT